MERMKELLVLHRLSRAAGRRDWFLVSSMEEVAAALQEGLPHDAFTFFVQPQLPIRGVGTEELAATLRAMLQQIPENQSELLVACHLPGLSRLEDVEGFSKHESSDLDRWLLEHSGSEVVAGRHPPLLSDTEQERITAVVPDERGNVEPGVY
jgi:hypothetical protein